MIAYWDTFHTTIGRYDNNPIQLFLIIIEW